MVPGLRKLTLRLKMVQLITKVDNKRSPRETDALELRGRGLPFRWGDWEWLPGGEDVEMGSDWSFHLEGCSQREA